MTDEMRMAGYNQMSYACSVLLMGALPAHCPLEAFSLSCVTAYQMSRGINTYTNHAFVMVSQPM